MVHELVIRDHMIGIARFLFVRLHEIIINYSNKLHSFVFLQIQLNPIDPDSVRMQFGKKKSRESRVI